MAGLAFGERGDVGAGDFSDIDQVEAGVHECGEFADQKVEDDAAGGGGLAVVGANGAGRVEDDNLLARLAALIASSSARNLERL